MVNTVIATLRVGKNPWPAAFDVAKDELFVPDGGNDNVSVIWGSNNTFAGSIAVGNTSFTPLYDSSNGDIYVPMASGNLTVINGTSRSVISSFGVGYEPTTPTLDPANGDLYVAIWSRVAVVSTLNDSTIEFIKGGVAFEQPTYDPGNGNLYISDQVAASGPLVTVVAGKNNTVVGHLTVGGQPYPPTYDPSNRELYFSNWQNGNVTVVASSNGSVLANIGVGSLPYPAAYDAANGMLYVSDYNDNTVSVINGSTNRVVATVPVGGQPDPAVYDPDNGCIYVANWGSGNVTVINGVDNAVVANIRVGANATMPTYDPIDKTLFVSNSASHNISVIFGGSSLQYPVTFLQHGLPSGVNWSTTMNGVIKYTTGATLTYYEVNGTYHFVPASTSGYAPSPSSGYVVVAGSGRTVTLNWSLPKFLVGFVERGLPPSTLWWVNLTGGPSIRLNSSGSVSNLGEPNGSYSFSTASANRDYHAAGGSFMVAGAPTVVEVNFTQTNYSVMFVESGLPGGTEWTVTLVGQTNSSNQSSIGFGMTNGTGYAFSVGVVSDYTATPPSGTIGVSGASVFVDIIFSRNSTAPEPLSVRASESVSGSGGGGSYCIGETGQVGTHPAWENVTFAAAASNGTSPYQYLWSFGDGSPNGPGHLLVHTYQGYGTWTATLIVTDAGNERNVTRLTISFVAPSLSAPVCSKSAPTFLGLPQTEGYALLGGVIVAFAAALAAITVRKRLRPSPPGG